MVYDITIEEHFYRLRGIIRSISGLWCMKLQLRNLYRLGNIIRSVWDNTSERKC